MRLVSLVPSWTETLLEAGAEVVGRTRFCVHPADRVAEIPVVGGTKKADLGRIGALRPDLLVLDREENAKAIADASPVPFFASHVLSVEDVARDLRALAARSEPAAPRAALEAMADRWRRIAAAPLPPPRPLSALPGVIEWVRPPEARHDRFVYLIWNEPLMAVGPQTFIGSMFRRLGFGPAQVPRQGRYPRVELETLDPERTVLLFASEPFPFGRYRDSMEESGFPAALVDGEAFGWFGARALRFLERELR